MTFILPSFGASAISAVPASGGGGGSAIQNDYSLDFDGTNSWLDIGDISSLTGSQANLSLSYWVKETTSVDHQGHLGSEGSTLGAIIYFASNWYFYNWKTGSEDFVVSRPTTGVWHSVIVTMNNSYQKVFVDGVLRYYNTASGSTSSTLYNDFNIGKDRNDVYLDGKMDEVALYQSTLSDGGVTSTGTTATGDVAAIYNSGVPTDLTSYSPIGWWRMGDNDSGTGTTVTDQGSGGNDGTLTNSPTFSIDAPPPLTQTYSLSLDGTDDFVDVGNSSDLAPSSITISAWIKVSGSVDSFNYIVSRAGSAYGSYHLRYTSANKFNAFIGHSGSTFTEATSSSTYTLTDWHHVAFTYDQTNLKLYVDGAEAASIAKTTAIDYTAGTKGTDTHIGKSGGTLNYASPSEGLIDEVAIFNTALSGANISSIYNSGEPCDISSLSPVGWWRMGDNDSGTGTTITDQGSGGNDGTLTNGPTFSTTVPS